MLSASHFFIIGHAVVDLIICTIVLPIGTVQWLILENFRSLFFCRLFMWVNMSAPLASLHVNTLVAFDRYFAVARPHVKFVRGRNRPAALVMSVIALAFAINFPQLIWRDIRETVNEGESPCYFPENGLIRILLVNVLQTVVYLAHIVTTIFLYAQVHARVKRLRKRRVVPRVQGEPDTISRRPLYQANSSSKQDGSSDSRQQNIPSRSIGTEDTQCDIINNKELNSIFTSSGQVCNSKQNPLQREMMSIDGQKSKTGAQFLEEPRNNLKTEGRSKALANATFRMLFIVTVVFTCTWFVQFILRVIPKRLLKSLRAFHPVLYALYTFVTFLIIFNSSINVVIYTVVNRDFRTELKKVWKNLMPKRICSFQFRRRRLQPIQQLM